MTSAPGELVHPSTDDPVAAGGSEILGGPMGRRALAQRWWSPVRLLIIISALAYAFGYLLDYSCRATAWAAPERYMHLCYSDIPPLYSLRGFADGFLPYLQTPPGGQPLEYPVLTGVFMQIAASITTGIRSVFPDLNASRTFFDVNVALLFIPVAITVVATALVVRRRPWDALMVAVSPCLILAATINWDMLPLAFAGIAFVLWARKREFGAGLLLGLAVAAKFYPVLFLIGFAVLALRTAQWKAFGRLLAGTALAWLAVNVPFMIANFDGWAYFYEFSKTRGEDFGSIYFMLTELQLPSIPAGTLNTLATGLFAVLALAIVILVLRLQRRPRIMQVLFLLVAAFAITNKVYSPQYVLWLIPLAVLARPRWRDYLIWQAGELIYFAAIWWFLVGYGNDSEKGLPAQAYALAIAIHVIATIYFAVMVIRDMVRPECDPVRTDGFAEDADDPAGGVFDNAPDRFTLRSKEIAQA